MSCCRFIVFGIELPRSDLAVPHVLKDDDAVVSCRLVSAFDAYIISGA